MSHISYVEVHRYLPPGVRRIIAAGGRSWIGQVDETKVLKYPWFPKGMAGIQIESKMFDVLGSHPRVIQSKGMTKDGLLLEFAQNGDLNGYLVAHPEVSLQRRLAWCIQAAEAVVHIHSKRVLHCDIRHGNFLLDSNLDLKLADFQGQHFSHDGRVILDGLSLESTKAYLPRTPADHATVRTDLFALGSAIHFIVVGTEVFPELDHAEDEDEIERRFRDGEFPVDEHVCASITAKCWGQRYVSAQEIVNDLEAVRDAVARGIPTKDIAKLVVPAPDKDDTPSKVPWLSGLCAEEGEPKTPPPYRQLVGSDLKIGVDCAV